MQQKKPDFLGALYTFLNIHRTTITPFLRCRFGSQALGFPGLFALGMLVCCWAAEPRMVFWLLAWIPALIVQRIITVRNKVVTHSRYAGWPWAAMKVPFLKQEKTALQFTEPMFCFIAGVLLLPWSHFMGLFLMFGFISLPGCAAIEYEIYNKRLERMKDAQLEAEAMSREMR